MNNILRNKSVKFPKLDKIDKSVRDELFASESEINDFLVQLEQQMNEFTAKIETSQATLLTNKDIIESESSYFKERSQEIIDVEIPDLNAQILARNNYLDQVKSYKEALKTKFHEVIDHFDYETSVLNHLKNKIEMKKTKNDIAKDTITLQSYKGFDKLQYQHRLNPDYFSSTTFFHQIVLPFKEQNEEVLLCTIDALPARWRNETIENWEMGAMFVNLMIRGENLAMDLQVYTTRLNVKKYGVAIFSDGSVNIGEDVQIKVYYQHQKFMITMICPSNNETINSEIIKDHGLLNIGIKPVIAGEITIPDDQYTVFVKASEILVGHGFLYAEDEAIYGPLETIDDMLYITGGMHFNGTDNIFSPNWNNGAERRMMSEDKKFGYENYSDYYIARINTIEKDNETNNDYRKTDSTKPALASMIYTNTYGLTETSNTDKKVYADSICELLIISLMELNLEFNKVYKVMGWVMIGTYVYQIKQLKLIPDVRTYPLVKNDKSYGILDIKNSIDALNYQLCGVELLFELIHNDTIDLYNNKTTAFNTNPQNKHVFPGISLTGHTSILTDNERMTLSEIGSKVMPNVHSTISHYFGTFQTKISENNNSSTLFISLNDSVEDGKNLCGFDLSILSNRLMNPESIANTVYKVRG